MQLQWLGIKWLYEQTLDKRFGLSDIRGGAQHGLVRKFDHENAVARLPFAFLPAVFRWRCLEPGSG
jgi:hypothetical protein